MKTDEKKYFDNNNIREENLQRTDTLINASNKDKSPPPLPEKTEKVIKKFELFRKKRQAMSKSSELQEKQINISDDKNKDAPVLLDTDNNKNTEVKLQTEKEEIPPFSKEEKENGLDAPIINTKENTKKIIDQIEIILQDTYKDTFLSESARSLINEKMEFYLKFNDIQERDGRYFKKSDKGIIDITHSVTSFVAEWLNKKKLISLNQESNQIVISDKHYMHMLPTDIGDNIRAMQKRGETSFGLVVPDNTTKDALSEDTKAKIKKQVTVVVKKSIANSGKTLSTEATNKVIEEVAKSLTEGEIKYTSLIKNHEEDLERELTKKLKKAKVNNVIENKVTSKGSFIKGFSFSWEEASLKTRSQSVITKGSMLIDGNNKTVGQSINIPVKDEVLEYIDKNTYPLLYSFDELIIGEELSEETTALTQTPSLESEKIQEEQQKTMPTTTDDNLENLLGELNDLDINNFLDQIYKTYGTNITDNNKNTEVKLQTEKEEIPPFSKEEKENGLDTPIINTKENTKKIIDQIEIMLRVVPDNTTKDALSEDTKIKIKKQVTVVVKKSIANSGKTLSREATKKVIDEVANSLTEGEIKYTSLIKINEEDLENELTEKLKKAKVNNVIENKVTSKGSFIKGFSFSLEGSSLNPRSQSVITKGSENKQITEVATPKSGDKKVIGLDELNEIDEEVNGGSEVNQSVTSEELISIKEFAPLDDEVEKLLLILKEQNYCIEPTDKEVQPVKKQISQSLDTQSKDELSEVKGCTEIMNGITSDILDGLRGVKADNGSVKVPVLNNTKKVNEISI